MKKQVLLLATFIFLTISLYAQQMLWVKKNEKGLYLDHTVAPKQSLYSLGRYYQVPPKDLAAFNNLDMDKGLQVDQVIKIPLGRYNFSQEEKKGIPVYYKVAESEGLYRVSVNNQNVSLDHLREWNGLQSDNIHVGANLVIGYLSGGEILATNAQANPVVVEEKKVEAQKVAVQQVVKEEDNPAPVQVKKEEAKPAADAAPANVTVAPVNTSTTAATGYFTKDFEKQVKVKPANRQAQMTAGIFKTSSGWQDGKYYLLIDDAEPGTIVKVMNPANSRFVYAKVLGPVSGIAQNKGYGVRISNAAASVLGIESEKFPVTINY